MHKIILDFKKFVPVICASVHFCALLRLLFVLLWFWTYTNDMNLYLKMPIWSRCSSHCKVWNRTRAAESLLQNTTFTGKHFCPLGYLYLCSFMGAFQACFSQGDKDLPSQIAHRSQPSVVPRVCAGTGLRFREKIFELSIEM